MAKLQRRRGGFSPLWQRLFMTAGRARAHGGDQREQSTAGFTVAGAFAQLNRGVSQRSRNRRRARWSVVDCAGSHCNAHTAV